MRLQIKPALRQVWRTPQTVQIGVDPRCAAVIDGLNDRDRELIQQLEHGVDPRDRSVVDGDRDGELLQLLNDAGVLVRSRAGRATYTRLGRSRDRLEPDAAAWSVVHGHAGGDGWEIVGARAQRLVEVHGGGRTGFAVALTLACAGVGQVRLRDPGAVEPHDVTAAAARPQHVGLPREQALRTAIATLTRRAPSRQLECTAAPAHEPPVTVEPMSQPAAQPPAQPALASPLDDDQRTPDLVVLVDYAVADAVAAQDLVRQDVAHLSVVVRETSTVVGPLVLPGAGPCLRCLDLHRHDRDPAWPRLLAQLRGERGAPAPQTVAEETVSSQIAASLAALQVLGHLDALVLGGATRPAALGATLEVELPDGLISRREWPAHASCGCHWPPRRGRAVADTAGQDARGPA